MLLITPAKPPLRTPKHGRGKLKVGGRHRPAGGRPPEALRMKSRAVFEAWLAWAEKRITEKDCDDQTRNVIGNTCAKYGLGTTTAATDDDGKVRDLPPVVLTISPS